MEHVIGEAVFRVEEYTWQDNLWVIPAKTASYGKALILALAPEKSAVNSAVKIRTIAERLGIPVLGLIIRRHASRNFKIKEIEKLVDARVLAVIET